MCESKELLVSFLYNEIDPADKRMFEKHLATCSECRDELAELGDTRAQIGLWTPPDADLGFRIVREPKPSRRPWFQFSPAWGLAAAAVLLLAIGAAIANLDVRYGSDGLVVRTGWNHAVDPTAASAAANVTPVDWKTQTDQLDRRLRDLEHTLSSRSSSPVQNASAADLTDDQVLQRAELEQCDERPGAAARGENRVVRFEVDAGEVSGEASNRGGDDDDTGAGVADRTGRANAGCARAGTDPQARTNQPLRRYARESRDQRSASRGQGGPGTYQQREFHDHRCARERVHPRW
ncbi:MAG: zf-HC2 domain-containing protein, partial [Acidobacteria bacterium]|nr:zf-HC2 domain-containing protein [Acidobacteriota bacterium]